MSVWGLDLGTTNSLVTRWDADARCARVIELPAVCRGPLPALDELGAPRKVPSAVHAVPLDLRARIGALPLVEDFAFIGDQAVIGRPALERNADWPSPAFTRTFKSQLSRDPLRAVARLDGADISAREAARLFLRELFAEVHAVTGERIRDLVLTTPVAIYEGYRAELKALAEEVGVRRVRFVDEPVAAAAGYGVGLDRARSVLVIDIGGGTLHAARVRLEPRRVESGAAEVLGKHGRPVGGNLVDRWFAEALCAELGHPLSERPADETEVLWQRYVLDEARKVKERLHWEEEAAFTLVAPAELRGVRARLGEKASLTVPRAKLVEVLEARGFYALLDEAVADVLGGAPVDEVLLVGGSTLLPGVYPRVEARFGRDRVRAWQPFEAVAMGAAAFGGGGLRNVDFIVHDYALLTHDKKTGEARHTVIVPAGTRFPSAGDLWRKPLVPTCAMGMSESVFKLVVYEIGRHAEDGARFGWDAAGTLAPMAPGSAPVVVALNEASPTLGLLDPPHEPTDRRPRLDVAFGVDADRWLIATIKDLKTGKMLMEGSPVVRLL